MSRRWIRPTGNCRPALEDLDVGFFLSPFLSCPVRPFAPLPDRPLAPLPDIAVLVLRGGERGTGGEIGGRLGVRVLRMGA